MTISDVLSSFYFGFLNLDDKVDITTAITAMYVSPTGKGILEAYASSGRTIKFVSSTVNGSDPADGDGVVYYNRAQIDNTLMINSSGNLFSAFTTRVVVHELLHTILDTPDLPLSVLNHDARFGNFSLAGTDYTGSTVTLTNTILGEIGIPADQMRLSYTGTVSVERLSDFNSEYGISNNFTF